MYCKALISSISDNQNNLSSYSYCGEKYYETTFATYSNNVKRQYHHSVLVALVLLGGLSSMAFAKYDEKAEIEIEVEDNKAVVPIIRIEPVYPKPAAEQGIEGSVVLSFTINSNGATENIKVVSAEPEAIFNKEAKRALKWKYTPSSDSSKKHFVQLDFVLSEDSKPADLVEKIKCFLTN